MLVIGVDARAGEDRPRWTGRHHDEGRGSLRGDSAAGLFDAVFEALHDGEQVAVGFVGPLTLPRTLPDEAPAGTVVAEAVATLPGVAQLDRLVAELARWRPWTRVSTSIPRWRATTSIMLWEAELAQPADRMDAVDATVDRFFDLTRERLRQRLGSMRDTVRIELPADPPPASAQPVANLAAAAALRAGLPVDRAQLAEPTLTVSAAL